VTDFPAPPVPMDCDLRNFQFMQLDVARLRDSDIAAMASGDEFRAAVMLWCAAWHQVPAASLPDDDKVLSQLAGFGRVVKEWQRVRKGALRGWIKCSDGRLYHPVVAEKAKEAWQGKIEQRWRTECARIKKYNQRNEVSLPLPTLEQFLSKGHASNVPRDTDDMSPGTMGECPRGQDGNVPKTNGACPHDVPREMASKGEGEGEKKDNPEACSTTTSAGAGQAGNIFDARVKILCDAASPMPLAINSDIAPMSQLIANGFSLELDILPAIEAAKREGKKFRSWDRLIGWVETQHAARTRASSAMPTKDAPAEETYLQKQHRIWSQQLTAWKRYGRWSEQWGGHPEGPHSHIPRDFVDKWLADHQEHAA